MNSCLFMVRCARRLRGGSISVASTEVGKAQAGGCRRRDVGAVLGRLLVVWTESWLSSRLPLLRRGVSRAVGSLAKLMAGWPTEIAVDRARPRSYASR